MTDRLTRTAQAVAPAVGAPARVRPGRWRSTFPYHWDADDLVSRRELLRLAVLTSGALFAGTAVLAVLGWLDNRRRGSPTPIVQVNAVPEGTAYYFNYPEPDDQAMLLHLPGGRFGAGCRIGHERRRDDLAAALEAEAHRHLHALHRLLGRRRLPAAA